MKITTKIFRLISRRQILKGISIESQDKELVGIIGPNGSGKSTLLHMLGALDRPTSGQVWLAGRNLADFSDDNMARIRRRRIGFVFQAFNLVPSLNVWENTVLPIGLDGRAVDVDL